MIFKLFFEYGFRSSKEILDLCKSNSGKIIYSSKYTILSNRDELLIKKLEINQSEDYYYINSKDNNFPKNIEIIEGDFIKYDKKSFSLIISTSSSIAFVTFDPGFNPTTRKSVLLEICEEIKAPNCSDLFFISVRDKFSNFPVKTSLLPKKKCEVSCLNLNSDTFM